MSLKSASWAFNFAREAKRRLSHPSARPVGLRLSLAVLFCLIVLPALAATALVSRAHAAEASPPNILLIVVDDLGIDQWKLFGYGGTDPVATPNIDTIANAGVK